MDGERGQHLSMRPNWPVSGNPRHDTHEALSHSIDDRSRHGIAGRRSGHAGTIGAAVGVTAAAGAQLDIVAGAHQSACRSDAIRSHDGPVYGVTGHVAVGSAETASLPQ